MKRWMIGLLFLWGASFASFAGDTAYKDSLLRVLQASVRDSSRLQVLYSLVRFDQMSPACVHYANRLLEEAVAQQNLYYQSLAMYAHVIYYYNHQDRKNVERWMSRLEKAALKNGYHDLYFAGKNAEIMMALVSRRMEYGITEAQKVYEEARKVNDLEGMVTAKICLMTAYVLTARIAEGREVCEDIYKLSLSPELEESRRGILQHIVLACHTSGDKNYFKYLEEYKSALASYYRKNEKQGSYRDHYLLLESLYAGYYLENNRIDLARGHLENADYYFSKSGFIPCRGAYYDAYSDYYRAIKDYDASLAYADTAFSLLSAVSENGGVNLRIKKAEILADAGREDEAIALYKKTLLQKDSIYRDLSVSQMDEVYQMYNMDKLLLEKEQHRMMMHTITLVLIGLALLMLVPFIVRIYYVRRKLKKDEARMRELNDISKQANKVKENFLTNMSYNIRIPLNNVVGFSQLMSVESDVTESERAEYASIIQANAAELIQLVNDVLDFSRLESGMMKFQMQEYEVLVCCSDIIGMCRSESEGCVEVDFQADIENLSFDIDFNRFSRAVLNMLLYPDPQCRDPRVVGLTVRYNQEKGMLVFSVYNSPLTDAACYKQIVDIRHEINRLLMAHFGGEYRIESGEEGNVIVFTYPVLR